MIDWLLSLIAPHSCVSCGTEGSLLCKDCAYDTPTVPSVCYICSRATKDNAPCSDHTNKYSPDKVFIRAEYKGYIRELVHKYKFEHKRSASDDMAGLISETLPSYDPKPVLFHVPTSGVHARAHGYDHTGRIARALSKKLKARHQNGLIKKKNVSQLGSSRLERSKQLKGVFAYYGDVDEAVPRHVLLVDDVVTTGATIEACSKVLKKAGVEVVDVVVFAKP